MAQDPGTIIISIIVLIWFVGVISLLIDCFIKPKTIICEKSSYVKKSDSYYEVSDDFLSDDFSK